MSDPERGAYTPPTDAPLAFDARRPARGGGGGRPMPLTLIVSALVLIALIGAIFFFYRSGVRGADDAPQPVGEPIGAFTRAAPAEAQPADPAAGLQIYNQDAPAAAEPTFAPGPEQPRPRPTTPVETEKLPPVVIAQAPAQPAPALKGPTTPAPAPAPKTPAPAPAAPAPAPKAATGSFAVQIGAFSSSAIADSEWRAATAGVSGKGKQVEAIERDGKTLYRTAVTGFTTRDQASAFCNQLKAAGKSCFVR